ncbi:MAG: N-acetyl-gamma-glutamyl-phosphate reductase [Candidatus Omnitrophica bacterium]|nr:N-acetyl-gamma-glutamyl-phosphate reductase [Candidatus Omnitrophota bacterium]
MLEVGIVGATGYVGEELIKILLKHRRVNITYLAANIDRPTDIGEIFGYLKGRFELTCELPDYKKMISRCQLLFMALPHTVSMEMVPPLLKSQLRIVDLSADYRLKDVKTYERFYKVKHKNPHIVKEAVYGLPELYRQKIKEAKLIANPGCYPTLAILAILPLLTSGWIELDSIIIDAKSGFSGAGRKVNLDSLFSEVNENFKAYKVNIHQHMPEIIQELSRFVRGELQINFVPHLLPINRGILETIYLKKKKWAIKTADIIHLYKRFYKKEPFIRIYEEGNFPQLKDVINTNFCDLGFYTDQKSKFIITVGAIDNLLKGASGQAVQNMNIMYGFNETEGLL